MAGARETALTAPDLTVVVPTFNERDNVRPLIDALDEALAHIHWEVVFVDDDSTDGTAAAVRAISRQDSRVRCVQRVGRRGLSSAVIEGILASSAPYVAVMDGDLQHPPELAARLKPLGIVADYAPPEKMLAEMREEQRRVREIARAAGLLK